MPVPHSQNEFRRQSLREIAESRIREAILDGTFEPGEMLHDGELQTWLGVSRTPIRDALNDLARIGLVETAPQRFTRVVSPAPGELSELFESVGAVLGGVIRVTIGRTDDAAHALILDAVDELQRAVANADSVASAAAIRGVAERIVGACRNEVLVAAVTDVVDGLVFRLAISLTQESLRAADMIDGCAEIRAGIIARDANAAAAAVETTFRAER